MHYHARLKGAGMSTFSMKYATLLQTIFEQLIAINWNEENQKKKINQI